MAYSLINKNLFDTLSCLIVGLKVKLAKLGEIWRILYKFLHNLRSILNWLQDFLNNLQIIFVEYTLIAIDITKLLFLSNLC